MYQKINILGGDMSSEEELKDIFKELTPENQVNLLTNARLARSAENAVKKSIHRGFKKPARTQWDPVTEKS
jgi:hypothetical protein